jgi:hypothetical protein
VNNNTKFAVVSVAAAIYESAKEALAAFEAEENAAMIVISADMDQEVRKDLGLTRRLGVWPWFQKDGEGLRFYEGRAQWYFKTPKVWTMKKGEVGNEAWRKGFVALMRALGM